MKVIFRVFFKKKSVENIQTRKQRGWGQRLLEAVELDVHTSHALALLTQASEHLQPLLLSRGYDVVESKVVELRGEHLPCVVMRKVLS